MKAFISGKELVTEYVKPVYFPAYPTGDYFYTGHGYNQLQDTKAVFIGMIPSLYLGIRAGWQISGKNYDKNDFTEIFPRGDFTGGINVGLIPKQL